ncbi:529_t:CDS:1, partial [Cetraspora pellucida]
MEQYATRTMEEPTLEIPGSKSLFLEALLEKAHKTIAFESSYKKRLMSLWDEFVTICLSHKLTPCPAHSDSLLMFLTWLNLLRKPVKPRLYL